MISLHLPLPPSNNSLYPSVGKRRIKSKAYEAWIVEAGHMLNMQNKVHFTKPVQVTYTYAKPRNKDGSITKAAMDCFNREKAVSDLLVKHGILLDDSLIGRGIVEWADMVGKDLDAGVDITIEPL